MPATTQSLIALFGRRRGNSSQPARALSTKVPIATCSLYVVNKTSLDPAPATYADLYTLETIKVAVAGGTTTGTTYANFVTFGGVDLTSNALPALVYVQIGCVSSVTDSSASVRWESVTFDTQMVGALQGDVQP